MRPVQRADVDYPDTVTGRAVALFREHARAIHRNTDRLFAALMTVQWLAAVLVALGTTPRTWAGPVSWVHPHVWGMCGACCQERSALTRWRSAIFTRTAA
jgi:hypothetical protein